MEAAEFATELESSKQQTNYAADISSIQEARDRIGPYIDKTPVLSSSSLNIIAGRTLFFKCEIFQKGYEDEWITNIINTSMFLMSCFTCRQQGAATSENLQRY